MKIVREYRWEMGHRLPFHDGGCRNLHGHSYKTIIEMEGEADKNGIVIDFYLLDAIMKPIIAELDHGFLVWKEDKELIDVLDHIKSKMVIVDFQSTAENICNYFMDKIRNSELPKNITTVKCKLYETLDCFVEDEIKLI